ncbi:MAG TPA: S8 family serine peptidase [Longimicrobium sp.]|nr:S8 family serine peptidase [Longimicrobium sp.]
MFMERVSDLPLYHDDMLLVKVRTTAAPMMAAAAAMGEMLTVSPSSGLSALSIYERAGLIKRVIPLARPAAARAREAAAPMAAMAGITATAVSFVEDDPAPNAGVAMIELHHGTAVRDLQLALAQDASVEYVAPVPVRYLVARRRASAGATGTASTPPAGDGFWNLKKISWNEARAAGFVSAEDVRVGILDTGVDFNHPDLPTPRSYLYDYHIPGGATSDRDIVGHGTHVMGTICARINNNTGVNGICAATPACYKIFGDQVKYITARNYFAFLVDPVLYHAALAECVEEKEQVVNLSIGGYGTPDPQELKLFQELIDNGCTVVAAMGNDNTTTSSYPAAIPGVVAVGATSYDDSRASFSNSGGHISLSAPGVGIWSTLPTYAGRTGNHAALSSSGLPTPGAPMARETDYAAWQGTSMAAPHVAAAAALLIARYGPLSPAEVRDRLMGATDRVPGMGASLFTAEHGAGRLNLSKL